MKEQRKQKWIEKAMHDQMEKEMKKVTINEALSWN